MHGHMQAQGSKRRRCAANQEAFPFTSIPGATLSPRRRESSPFGARRKRVWSENNDSLFANGDTSLLPPQSEWKRRRRSKATSGRVPAAKAEPDDSDSYEPTIDEMAFNTLLNDVNVEELPAALLILLFFAVFGAVIGGALAFLASNGDSTLIGAAAGALGGTLTVALSFHYGLLPLVPHVPWCYP